MTAAHPAAASPRTAPTAFPRYLRIGRHRVSSYKACMIVGLISAVLISAAVAERSGVSPFRMGVGALAVAVSGLLGARLYHLAVFYPRYREIGLRGVAWDPARGGGSVFGGLAAVPVALAMGLVLDIPVGLFADSLALGIAVGGAWIRLGCVFNGCCGGRPSDGWLALPQHDTRGVRTRRIPVQWLEIGWWLAAALALSCLSPAALPAGSRALGLLTWYGAGRFALEPLREQPDRLWNGWRVDRAMAALLALAAGAGLIVLLILAR